MQCELHELRSINYHLHLHSYGVAAGAEAFANSVASGFEGVVVSIRRIYHNLFALTSLPQAKTDRGR